MTRITSVIRKSLNRIYPPRHALFYLQRQIMRPRLRERMADWATTRLPPAPHHNVDEQSREMAESLRRDGYVMLDDIAPLQEIEEVKHYLADRPVYDRWNPGAGIFQVDNRPADCHTAPYSDEDVINCPYALGWANHPQVLGIAEQMLGAKPTISGLSIWWSFAGHAQPQEAEFFHRDVDDLRFVKFFIYLTDVGPEAGPHKFTRTSHRIERLTKICRFTDEEVEQAFPGERVTFTGPAGTAFLENTFGIHKGQLAQSRDRLLFQAQYSLHPIGIYEYSPGKPAGGRKLELDPYINRLYVHAAND